jgi:hypothetical protein
MRFLRIMIVMHSETPWTKEQREQVHERVEKALLSARRRGKLTPPDWSEAGQSIKGLDVHLTPFPPPNDGREAYRQGFWRRENPFEKGTEQHTAWNMDYAAPRLIRDFT